MNKLLSALLIVIVICSTITIQGQVSCDLTIENQTVVGTDFYFDLYLRRTGTEEFYLGTCDFVLTFNYAAFTNPVISKVSALSNWNLISEDGSDVGSVYRSAVSPAAIDNLFNHNYSIIINLNLVNFSDQSEFDGTVAKISSQPSTSRLGRYKITGINNSASSMNLQWKTVRGPLPEIITAVYTFGYLYPWISSQVTVNAINPGNSPLPVELTSFNAISTESKVTLNWQTATEVNNYGFEVERQTGALTGSATVWETVGFIEGSGNSNSEKSYSFVDDLTLNHNLTLNNPAPKVQYRLKQIDNDGTFSYSNEVEVEIKNIPTKFVMEQNYPNPFNPSTKIRYSIPQEVIGEKREEMLNVTLKIYDILGNEVATLVNEPQEPGYYEIDFNAKSLASGVYIYKLQYDKNVSVKKMIMMK
jgi:hypothetical protein